MIPKYRAIPIDDKDFIYGSLVTRKRDGVDVYYIYDSSWDELEICDYDDEGKVLLSECFTQVKLETIGPWIGLQDKNGTDVYVGDNVGLCRDHDVCFTVFWDEHHKQFDGLMDASTARVRSQKTYGYIPYNISNAWEVIGNIYQNHEFKEG